MFLVLLLSLFCIGLPFCFYLKKGKKQAKPDYSHIIFKDYSLHLIPSTDARTDEAGTDRAEGVKAEENTENTGGRPDDLPAAILNFED
jgi:hypothetical protein